MKNKFLEPPVSEASAFPGYTQQEVSDATGLDCGGYDAMGDFIPGSTMVQQQFKDEVDVNTILRRFGAGVALWRVGSPQGFYADFSDVNDYDSAVEKVRSVNERFMALPAELREKVGNDPGKLLEKVNAMSEDEWADFIKIDEPPAPPAVVPPVGGEAPPA